MRSVHELHIEPLPRQATLDQVAERIDLLTALIGEMVNEIPDDGIQPLRRIRAAMPTVGEHLRHVRDEDDSAPFRPRRRDGGTKSVDDEIEAERRQQDDDEDAARAARMRAR